MSDPADVTNYDADDGPCCAICDHIVIATIKDRREKYDGQPISADEAFRLRHDADEADHDALHEGGPR